MKNLSLLTGLIVLLIISTALNGLSASHPNVDPCRLMSLEKVAAAFPAIQKAQHKTYGAGEVCNYVDKLGLPALIVTIGQDSESSARGMMANLGDGYTVKDVAGLGDEAAMAVTKPEPKYSIPGDLVAELYIRKGSSYLLLAPARIEIKDSGPDFDKLLSIARQMLSKIP